MYERSSSAESSREFQSSSNETGIEGSTHLPLINSSTNVFAAGSDENLTTLPDSVSTGGKNSLMESSHSADIIQHEPDRSQDHSDMQA